MEVVSPGANGQVPPVNVAGNIDPNLVVQHLVDVLEVTLGASRSDLDSLGSLLYPSKRSETIQRCTRFAAESQVVLYIRKDVSAPEAENRVNGSSGTGPFV